MKDSFNYKRKIETAGWSIHPFGSYYGYLLGSVDEALLNVLNRSVNEALLNVLNSLADSVNEIAFMLTCWLVAMSESERKGNTLQD